MKARTTRRKSQFIKLKARPPYLANGKTALPNVVNKSGVYIIKENAKIVYVGYSGSNIYKTMYRHFQKWNHTGQSVVTYEAWLKTRKYTIQVTLCPPARAEKLERALVKKHNPRDNENKYTQYQLKLTDIELVNDFYETSTEEAPF
jgi:excinuclease UvrABC nuclease subunit